MENDNNSTDFYLNDDDLKRELCSYGEKNILPEKIIDKTYTKLKEKNIRITNEQLKSLISRLANDIKNMNSINKNDFTKKNTDDIINDNHTNNNIIATLKNIEKRIFKLEQYYSNIRDYNHNSKNLNQNNYVTENKKNNLDIVKLNEIPLDAQSIVILMKWLQYLVDQLGKSQISDVLNFYVDVGWITEDIKFDLLKYIKGITDNEDYNSEDKNRKITSKEHIHSLLFIQKLKGKNMDDFLWKIDQDLEKFFKNIENHYPNQI